MLTFMNKFIVVLFLAFAECTHTGSPPPAWTGQVIDCGGEVVRKCGPQLLGPVNTCLARTSDWTACLLALIPGVECGAETTLACVVRHTGRTAASGTDVLSGREAANAEAFIRERGYTFATTPSDLSN